MEIVTSSGNDLCKDSQKLSLNMVPENLEQSIKEIIHKKSFKDYIINTECASTQNGSILSSLYYVHVKGKIKNNEQALNFFVKIIKSKIDALNMISLSTAVETEIFAYKEVSKIIAGLQEQANIPENERYKMAKFYTEGNSKSIILENITMKGFTLYERMDVASLRFVEIAVQELAKFHALSFVMKQTRAEYFNKKLKTLRYPVIFDDNWTLFVEQMKIIILGSIDNKYKERVEKVYGDIDKYHRYCCDETVTLCLCHGDYKPNNIMSKAEVGEVREILAVDYQFMHYGCPVYDFLVFIVFSTDRKFRKAHLLNIKNQYYETMKTFLEYFKLHIEDIFPREEFEKIFKERLDFGLFISLLFLPLVFVIPTSDGMQFDNRLKSRLEDVIEDYIEWGFI